MAVSLDAEKIAWCRIGEHHVFLDLARDRYFRLAPERERSGLERLPRERAEPWHQPDILPRPDAWCRPRANSPACEIGDFQLTKVARAMWVQRRVERRLAQGAILSVLLDLRRANSRRAHEEGPLSDDGAAMVRAFENARLLRTAADRCLGRSIALAGCLAASADSCMVVLGVTLAPFTAHCWAQKGDVVLNDTLEEVLRYTPILVV
jgi:hypothetical protein